MELLQNVKDCVEADLIRDSYLYSGVTAYTNVVLVPPPDIAPRINTFIKESNLYNSRTRRWKGMPQCIRSQNALCSRIELIMQAIVEFFGIQNRWVIWEESKDIEMCYTMNPQLMVVGRNGTSFKNKEFSTHLDYEACMTPFAVRRDHPDFNIERLAVQAGIFARHCFNIQRNRRFVYSFVIVQNDVILFQFDRHGGIYSKAINYHESPEIFVRWLLAAVSPDEVLLGFNLTTKWREGRRFIQTLDAQSQPVEFEVSLREMSWRSSSSIVGPGRIYWNTESSSDRYVIKEEWRLLSDPREEEFLVAARGLDGVTQLISYETGETISSLRWGFAGSRLQDRRFIRIIVAEHSGRSIKPFTSSVELLTALQDAVSDALFYQFTLDPTHVK
ncbi:hypothetical protein AX16_006334 [Volvariella volvacea WC 439]|nr:hypothetical protein AX16_006334 [Volvariella volvacea WC 439]